jgi:hypothetical protein
MVDGAEQMSVILLCGDLVNADKCSIPVHLTPCIIWLYDYDVWEVLQFI